MDRVFFMLLILSLFGCSSTIKKTYSTVESDLYGQLVVYKNLEEYKTCVLLGELVLSDEIIQDLRKKISESLKKNICHYYLLAKRSGEQHDVDKYIEILPSGKEQHWIWKTHFDAGFPVNFYSPYFILLANQARNNDKALDKLISGLPYADASFGETLTDTIADIYKFFPERVLRILKMNNISERNIKLITETAKYQRNGG